jgi:N-succinyldiaminopimelate aminotransferase
MASIAPRPLGVRPALAPFGTTIFSEMTRLASTHGAVNLSQGFPDFEGPAALVDAVADALRSGHNQYARSQGHPELVEALAARQAQRTGLTYDPMTEVVVTAGATEAIASALFGLLEPGDEVVLVEPFYDSYPACLAMVGATPRYVTLEGPERRLDVAAVRAAITPRTRGILLNTPHNPTGRVLDEAELRGVAALAIEHDLFVLSDEVYEELVYDDHVHRSIASLPGMRERTLVISSAGKTFSFTGWKIGWAFGPPALVAAVQAAHQFVTFAVSTPVQVGLARALRALDAGFSRALVADYTRRRDHLLAALVDVGFAARPAEGSYFLLADFAALADRVPRDERGPGGEVDDRVFARWLTARVGVAVIPPSVFYAARPEAGRGLVRFAFCKRDATLNAAIERLSALRGA